MGSRLRHWLSGTNTAGKSLTEISVRMSGDLMENLLVIAWKTFDNYKGKLWGNPVILEIPDDGVPESCARVQSHLSVICPLIFYYHCRSLSI